MISEPKPSALIIGSISLDTLNLPMGDAYDLLGGSAAYAAIACSKLAQPHLVSAVGADFPSKHRGALDELRIDLAGLRVHDDGQTLAWGARYDESLSETEMLWARLGVFEAFTPEIPTHCRDCRWVLLANLPPLLQRHAWEQLRAPEFIVADTMSMWIEADRESVWSVMCEADLALMNEAEAILLTGEVDAQASAKALMDGGAKRVVVKRGAQGALLWIGDDVWEIPAPATGAVDPTGAGDVLAGGLIGQLARTGDTSPRGIIEAAAMGTALASIVVENFGPSSLTGARPEEIEPRLRDVLMRVVP